MTSTNFTSSIGAFSLIQTFFADPAAVGGSSELSLTSIGLYFKQKAPATGNVSGTINPGVTIAICEVRNDVPEPNRVHRLSYVRKSRSEIDLATTTTGVLSESSATDFVFDQPIKLTTGRVYGIVIKFDDPAYTLHKNVAGEALIGTNTISTGSPNLGSFIPKLYRNNNSGVYTPVNNTDLAITVRVAKYTANTATIQFVNRDYEFMNFDTRTNNFIDGEMVYQQTANSTGSIAVARGNTTVVGTGTTFSSDVTANSQIVLVANSTAQQVVRVSSVANNTLLTLQDQPRWSNTSANYQVTPVGKLYDFDPRNNKITLVDSTAANSTFLFTPSSTLVGDVSNATANLTSLSVQSVDSFTPRISIVGSSISRTDAQYVFAARSSTNTYPVAYGDRDTIKLNETNNIQSYDGHLQSRSQEVLNTLAYGASRKTGLIEMDLSVTTDDSNLYSSPALDVTEIDIFVGNNTTSNTYTAVDANTITYDTEVTNAGIAQTKHITIKTGFANNRLAEDIRVFAAAYRPLGTEVRIYAKVHNSADPDTFDDKQWTPLQIIGNESRYSSTEDPNDLVEYEYGFQQFPDTAESLAGSFTTQSGNTQIACTNDPSTELAVNDLIKIYSPQFPDNYEVAVATAVNTSIITVASAISNNNVVGSGLSIDRLLYKNTAFNNIQNDNVVRYFNSNLNTYDKYDSMQVKVVMLSDLTYLTPKVDQLQVIGVSA